MSAITVTEASEGKKRTEKKTFDTDLRLIAEGLLRQLLDREFCIALLVMKDMFNNCNAASEYLQRSPIDLLAAIEAVNNLRATLLLSRTDASFAAYEKVAELLKNKHPTCLTTEDTEPEDPVTETSTKIARQAL